MNCKQVKMAANNDNQPSTELRPKLQTNVVSAFIAGVVLANFNKNLILGVVVDTLAGAYAEQTFPGYFPNMKQFWLDLKQQ